eukprot:scaffold34319_cov80-Skeletonema_marinoi.AAC.1
MTSHSNGDGAAAARSRWTWSELQTIISAGDLHKLARSEEQEQTYCKARSKFLAEEGAGQKKRSKPTFEEWRSMVKLGKNDMHNKTRTVLCLNDFPYYFEEGIEHWVVWKLGEDVSIGEIENGKMEILKEAGCSNKEFINDTSVFLHWLNPPELKSLPYPYSIPEVGNKSLVM